MAFFSKSNYKNPDGRKGFSMRDVLYTSFVLLLFGGVLAGGHYAWGRINQLNVKNEILIRRNAQLEEENTRLSRENLTLSQENSEMRKELELLGESERVSILRQKGINPDILTVKSLEISYSWDANLVSYKLLKAFLAPDIADLGDLRNTPKFSGKSYLMVEIEATDQRNSGVKQKVPVNDYLRLRDGVSLASPDFEEYLELGPGEKGKLYTGYAVENTETTVILRVGYITLTEDLNLDFSQDSVQNLQGVFMLRKGYAARYEGDE